MEEGITKQDTGAKEITKVVATKARKLTLDLGDVLEKNKVYLPSMFYEGFERSALSALLWAMTTGAELIESKLVGSYDSTTASNTIKTLKTL